MRVPVLLSLAEKHLDTLVEDIMLTRFLQDAGAPTPFVAVVAQPSTPDETVWFCLKCPGGKELIERLRELKSDWTNIQLVLSLLVLPGSSSLRLQS